MNSKLLLSLPPVLSPFAATADVLGLQVRWWRRVL